MIYLQVDFKICYRDQDISIISKIIEKVSMIKYFLIRMLLNINLFIYSLRNEIKMSTLAKGGGLSRKL